MTDTTISDAFVAPQDDGTGVPNGSEDYTSAAYFQALAKYKGDGSYVGEDNTGSATLQFANVDTGNNTVDVLSGYAYVLGGPHIVQTNGNDNYATQLPIDTPYVVVLPSSVTGLDLADNAVNDLWLALDPTQNDEVYIRHGSGLSAPSDPSVKLGTVNTSDGSTTRPNDLFSATGQSLSVEDVSATTATIAGQFRFVQSESELTDALNNSSVKRIYLAGDFSQDRTINSQNAFMGGFTDFNHSRISGNWTINQNLVSFQDFHITGTITLTGFAQSVTDCYLGGAPGEIVVGGNSSQASLSGITGGNVTFESGSSPAIIDSSVGVSITDNTGGSITIGDVA